MKTAIKETEKWCFACYQALHRLKASLEQHLWVDQNDRACISHSKFFFFLLSIAPLWVFYFSLPTYTPSDHEATENKDTLMLSNITTQFCFHRWKNKNKKPLSFQNYTPCSASSLHILWSATGNIKVKWYKQPKAIILFN